MIITNMMVRQGLTWGEGVIETDMVTRAVLIGTAQTKSTGGRAEETV